MDPTASKEKKASSHFSWKQLFSYKTYKNLLDTSDYALPLEAWNATTNVLVSIFAASFVINLLSLAFPLALLQVYDRIIPNNAMNTLVLLLVGVGAALLFEACFRVARSYVGAWADSKFEHVTGCKAFAALTESSLSQFESEGSGIHLKRMNALGMLREYYAGQALISIADIPFIIIIFAVIGYIAHWIVIVPIVIVVLYIFLTFKEANKLERLLTERSGHDERRFNFIIETLGHIHTVKSITMEAQMQRRYERLQKVSAVYDYELSMKSSVSSVAGISVSQLMVICIVAVGSILVIKGQLTIGGLAACTLLSGRCLQPINLIIGLWTRLQSIKIANDEIRTLLSMPRECPATLPDLPRCHGAITFENVNFQYSEHDPWIFKNLNLKIDNKETIALTGEGLAGKSTLLWLLLGLYKPNAGKVLIDDQDISLFQVESVRKKIAYLPQTAVMFKGTIMENLTMFNVDEFYDYAKEVCRAVGIAHLIEQLPKGYETVVGDQTIDKLSRGLNQRIAIARALVRNPKIVVFDEANTAIDMQGDEILGKALEHLKGRCTMILVSHRPSILKMANVVYQFDDGKLRVVSE